ncbi:hypothetical protein SAMN04489859_104915 [Paracoccus alcaliphilus]|uniref:Uncharacterized protein n=1 Tax=Paracoccus alcaliphilus TaxID=34002 RepID=A0A1H8N0U2_9RHOB|nr:hypothetical protein [Paracoccus alcaliphilus]WCR18733.1 hypothetical protein JHW40_03145 [Paracoccus alcaliphilus]SEO23184.1 hypothetical protein SAMN04489859_104915 [Paracoccus alcaliphilus]
MILISRQDRKRFWFGNYFSGLLEQRDFPDYQTNDNEPVVAVITAIFSPVTALDAGSEG